MARMSVSDKARRIRSLAQRDGMRCRYCRAALDEDGPDMFRPILEHWTPKSRGGSNDLSNLVLACKFCDTAKGAMTGDEFLGQKESTP
jgi:5-methylcytosine-specific restriction endonuclease McrA